MMNYVVEPRGRGWFRLILFHSGFEVRTRQQVTQERFVLLSCCLLAQFSNIVRDDFQIKL